MERRIYFVLGDLTANLFAGAAAAVAVRAVVGGSWNVLLAMIVGVLIASVVGLVVSFAFIPFFGAFEVMLPAMLGGMVVGMSVPMVQTWRLIELDDAAGIGAIVGVVALAGTYIFNAYLHDKG